MNWTAHAAHLADTVTHSGSPWAGPVASIPRHEFVPRWWHRGTAGWTINAGEDDHHRWLDTAYSDRSLITSVGPLHADHAAQNDHPVGLPTSSSTLPSLLVRMFQHARLGALDELLDVGTGSGYGTALACRRLGDRQVTSIDVDPYLVDAARERLEHIKLRPNLVTLDATGELPGAYDRIVASVGVRPVPVGWLAALRPGGRLVTTIGGTSLIVTAEKQEDGSAVGRVEWDRAGFMRTRHGADYPPGPRRSLPRRASRTERTSPPARIRSSTSSRRGTWPRCSTSQCPGSCTATQRMTGCARRGLRTRTDHGPAPPPWAPTRLRFTSREAAACGTPSTRSAPTGSSTASCLCAEPTS